MFVQLGTDFASGLWTLSCGAFVDVSTSCAAVFSPPRGFAGVRLRDGRFVSFTTGALSVRVLLSTRSARARTRGPVVALRVRRVAGPVSPSPPVELIDVGG